MTSILLFANHVNGYQITKYLLSRSDASISQLVVLPDTKSQWWPSVRKLGKQHGLPVHMYINEMTLLKHLRRKQFDLIISANWRLKISPEILSLAKLGGINFHNSLLPKHRGSYANSWAISEGDTVAGVAVHWMSSSLDTGKIIARRSFRINSYDTARTVWDKMNREFLDLFTHIWPKRNNWRKMSRSQRGTPSYHTIKEYKLGSEIELKKSWVAKDFINFLRARTFEPHYNDAYFIDPNTKKKVFISVSFRKEE